MAGQKKIIITIPAKPKPAVNKKPKKKGGKPKEKDEKTTEAEEVVELTLKEKSFCIEYLNHQCNGTAAALIVFDITNKEMVDQDPPKEKFEKGKLVNQAEIEKFEKEKFRAERVASAMASEYLRKPNIIKFIHSLLVKNGLTDDYVDLQLFKVINQDFDNKTKVAAIKEYNAMKGRLKPTKLEHSGSIGLAAAYEAAAQKEEEEDGDN